MSSEQQTGLPGQQTIAFAVAIVASKPAALTVKEYIRLLRKHVAKGRRENAISAVYRHLDTTSYWRGEHERVRSSLIASERETATLKMHIDSLNAELELAKTSAVVKGKRKAIEKEVGRTTRASKKVRAELPVEEEEEDVHINGRDKEGFGADLLAYLFGISTCLQTTKQDDPVILASHIIRAAEAVPRSIRDVLHHTRNSADDDDDDDPLTKTLSAVCRASKTFFVGLVELEKAKDGVKQKGQVIYAVAQMFSGLISCFHELSALEVDGAAHSIPEAASKLRSKSKVQTPSVQNLKSIPRLSKHIRLLCGITDQLVAESESHRELFEAFLFCIVSELGKALYCFTFGKPRSGTIAGDIAASADSAENEDGARVQCSSAVEEEAFALRQAKLEAPYLIHLLNHCMAVAPSFLNASASAKGPKQKGSSKRGRVTKSSIGIAAKERLQITLVSSIFGTEGLTEAQDMFLESLKMPANLDSAISLPKLNDRDVVDWFSGEMWKILGWELLASGCHW